MRPARSVLLDSALSIHHRMVRVPRTELVASALARQVGRAASLLDVGAGDGEVGARVAQLAGATRVEGVDVLVSPSAKIPVRAYDGLALPFADGEFDVVTLSDVLHHAARPARLLAEALRVARVAVALKDHFRFGRVSGLALYAMDVVGNARARVLVRGRYLTPAEWVELVRAAGGRFRNLEWPLRVHEAPVSWMTSSKWQFAARVVRSDLLASERPS